VGDEVLYEFARRLSDTSKRRDLPARVGGEEFAVLLPGSALDEAEPFAQALRQTIAERPFNRVGELTSSLGLAQWKPGEPAAALLDRADQALYRAKSQGRNQVCQAA
jgi:diguanylate cyclase (GGDEF)-like protein